MKMPQEVAPLRIEPTLFQHRRPSHRSILSHQTWHWSRRWTEIPKEELVEFTGMEGTRDRWALTVHMMAAVKFMSGTSAGSSFHRELGSQRKRWKWREQYHSVHWNKTGKFIRYRSVRGRKVLINIATGTVAHLRFRNLYSGLRSKAKRQWESLSKPG